MRKKMKKTNKKKMIMTTFGVNDTACSKLCIVHINTAGRLLNEALIKKP